MQNKAKSKVAISVMSIAFSYVLAFHEAPVYARDVAGVTMPENVSVSGKQLQLNGMGMGKKAFLKVYVIALYLENPTSEAQNAIQSDEAKRIVLTMLRDVSREKFVQEVEKGMMLNSNLPMKSLRERLDRLESILPALRKGNVLDFTYLPAQGTLMRGQGSEITIPGKDFADVLFSVWLNSKSSNPGLQQQLLGGIEGVKNED